MPAAPAWSGSSVVCTRLQISVSRNPKLNRLPPSGPPIPDRHGHRLAPIPARPMHGSRILRRSLFGFFQSAGCWSGFIRFAIPAWTYSRPLEPGRSPLISPRLARRSRRVRIAPPAARLVRFGLTPKITIVLWWAFFPICRQPRFVGLRSPTRKCLHLRAPPRWALSPPPDFLGAFFRLPNAPAERVCRMGRWPSVARRGIRGGPFAEFRRADSRSSDSVMVAGGRLQDRPAIVSADFSCFRSSACRLFWLPGVGWNRLLQALAHPVGARARDVK